jgi:branched-chain amino acid transport system substrate-binding protein
MKKITMILLSLALVSFMSLGALTHAEEAVEYLTMGSVHPLSGPAAPWGVLTDNGIKLAADQINNRGELAATYYNREMAGFTVKGKTYKWKIESYDSRYEPMEGVSAVTRLADNGVKYAYITGGAIVVAAHDVTSRNGMLAFGAAALGKAGLNSDFPLTFQFETEGEAAAAIYPWLMKTYDVKSIAALNPDDDTGYAVNQFCEFVAGQQKLSYSVEYYDRDIKDFYPVLTRILAKKPDAIDCGVSPPDTAVLIIKQARELGHKGVILAQQGVDANMLFSVAGAEHAEGVVAAYTGAADYTPGMKMLKDEYIKMFGEKQWLDFGLLYVDPLFIITQAMEETQSLDPRVIAEYMPTMEVSHTAWNPLPRFWAGSKYYGVDHILVNPIALSVVENGEFVFKGFAEVPHGVLD